MFTENSIFYKEIAKQLSDQIVDINNSWYIGEPTPYEEGAREKFSVICPSICDYEFLIPKHKYMVKRTHRKKESGHVFYHQFWSEIIAYKIGKILGVKTVPAFIARINDSNGVAYTALSEWYFNYPNLEQRFIKLSGGDIFAGYLPYFDREKGKQHNLKGVKEIFTEYLPNVSIKVYDWELEFSKILLLDAIIGNTDRHQDNWEVIYRMVGNGFESYISPAFDNGTSLGWEILDKDITTKMNNISAYINNKNATHHLKATIGDKRGIKLIDTLNVITTELNFPKEKIVSILNADITQIENEIAYLQKFDVGEYSLTNERIDFIVTLIIKRISLFKEML